MAMTRREFIRMVGAAAGTAVPLYALATACSDGSGNDGGALGPGGSGNGGDRRTTLDATIGLAAGTGYRALVWKPGEPFLLRDDLGVSAGTARSGQRRSLLYFGQLSDTHIIDAQTPSRADWSFALEQNPSALRPQETLSVHVLAEMVNAVNALDRSVVTGAPCAVTVITGDLADSGATTELDWYLTVLAGGTVTANSGAVDRYEGVQAWEECTYAWHPDDPSNDIWGQNGFPAVPGLLDAAVSQEVTSAGLKTPWLSVLGNHDTVWLGTLGAFTPPYQQLAVGGAKVATPPPNTGQFLLAAASPGDPAAEGTLQQLIDELPSEPGVRTVTPDPQRREFTRREIIDAHFTIGDEVGPVGHGFTEESRTTGDAWWTWQVGPAVRFIALDTNNRFFGPDGSLPQDQWDWLEQQLIERSSRYLDASGNVVEQRVNDQLIVILSHHTSWTMDNVQAAPGDTTTLHTGAELVDLLLRFPNVVAWCNGHTHVNRIVPHPSTSSEIGGGFWEINTPSCIDWGQQSRMVEIVDNRDGTLSLFTLSVDHAGDPQVTPNDFSQVNMASLSRQLAANPWFWDAAAGLGTPEDRNTELLVTAPFDLSKYSDDDLEKHEIAVGLRELVPGALI